MAGLDFYYILKPESSKNLILDSSFEVTTTGTTVVGTGTRARTTAQKQFGLYSIAVTPSSGTTDGMYIGSYTLTAGLAYTFSIYGLWASGVPYLIRFANTSGTLLGAATTWTGAGIWERKEVTYTPGTTVVRLYVTKNNSASTAVYYVDGAQLEQKAYSTTYINGDLPGCYWDGPQNNSPSGRYANYRGGGTKVLLSTYNGYVTDMSGVGTPDVESIVLPYGYDPGGLYQGTLTRKRTMTIGCSVSGGPTGDLTTWSSNMEAIYDLVKPDLVYPEQPFTLGFQHEGNDVEIECVYIDGMKLDNEKLKEISDITLQVECPFPYWKDVNESSSIITNSTQLDSTAVANADIYARDTDGVLRNLTAGGTNNITVIHCMYIGPFDGKLYVGGVFTTIGGTSATNIAAYDFTTGTWSAFGSGCNAAVRCIVQLDNGNLVVGGDFTTANGVTTRSIAQWTGATFAIIGIANPFNAAPTPSVKVLKIDPITRNVWVGGTFAAVASGTNSDYLAHITVTVPGYTLAWNGLGHDLVIVSSGGTGSVNDIAFFGKYMWVTGMFSSTSVISGTARTNNGIAKADTITSGVKSDPSFLDIGTGLTSTTSIGNALAISKLGEVYLCGQYTSINSVSITGLAKYDGYQWIQATTNAAIQVGTVTTKGRSNLFFDSNDILTGSYITHATASTFEGIQLIGQKVVRNIFHCTDFTGVTWFPSFGYNPGNGEIYISTNSCTLDIETITSIDNTGSAKAYPLIRVKMGSTLTSPASIYYIKNNTNGSAIYFESQSKTLLHEMFPARGEVVEIMTMPGKRGVYSSYRQNGLALDDSTQLEKFFLSPGLNSIEVLTTVTPELGSVSDLEISFIWNDLHWTFHGGHL